MGTPKRRLSLATAPLGQILAFDPVLRRGHATSRATRGATWHTPTALGLPLTLDCEPDHDADHAPTADPETGFQEFAEPTVQLLYAGLAL